MATKLFISAFPLQRAILQHIRGFENYLQLTKLTFWIKLLFSANLTLLAVHSNCAKWSDYLSKKTYIYASIAKCYIFTLTPGKRKCSSIISIIKVFQINCLQNVILSELRLQMLTVYLV